MQETDEGDWTHAVRELGLELQHIWGRPELLEQALTHSSYGNAVGVPHSERLEFLGDSVLDLVTAEWLMAKYPNEREGFMSQERAELVRTCALAQCARNIGIPELLRVGHGQVNLRRVESVLADAMEAVVGSAYLDGGLVAARAVALAAGILPCQPGGRCH